MRTLTIRPGALVIEGVSRIAANWFCIALAVRLLAMLAIHIFSLNRGFGGFYPLASGHDDGFYFGAASAVARGEDVGTLPSFYPLLLGAIFSLTGPDLIVGKIINVLAGSLCVAVGVILAKDLARDEAIFDSEKFDSANRDEAASHAAGERAGHLAGFFLSFYPSFVWYSTQLVKDPLLILFGLWSLLIGIRSLRQPRPLRCLLWLATFCGLFVFRTYAALTLGLAVLLFTVRFRRKWLGPLILLAGIGPLAAGQGLFGWNQIQPWLDAERLESFREVVYSTGGSAANVQVDYSSPFGFLLSYPYSFATAMFGPFPWQLRGGATLAAVPEVLAIWPLMAVWGRGLIEIWRGRGEGLVQGAQRAQSDYAALLMLFSLILIAAVALFSDNIGANTRLRLLPWCAFLIFAAVRLQSLPLLRRLNLAGSLRLRLYSRHSMLQRHAIRFSPKRGSQSLLNALNAKRSEKYLRSKP